jgi:ribosomal protein L11 methyltransferase
VTALVVEVVVAGGAVEAVSDELWSLGATAVEERLAGTGSTLLVSGYPTDAAARAAAARLARRHRARVVDVGDGWADAWRRHAEPVDTGPLVVVPGWRDVSVPLGRAAIRVDPGWCFGSGSHPTTRLALVEVARRVAPGATVLDVGTGSGILAVAAAVRGAARVDALDIDAEAVEVTRANATRNGVADRVMASTAAVASLARTFDVVVANLTAAVLAGLASDLVAAVAPQGWLVVTGMLAGQWAHVADRFAVLSVVDRPELDGWTAVVLRAG